MKLRDGAGDDILPEHRLGIRVARRWGGPGGGRRRASGRRGIQLVEVDKELLAILVCPQSHAPLVQVGDWLYSTDEQTRRRYPVQDGIPVMLIDESETVDIEEFKRVMGKR